MRSEITQVSCRRDKNAQLLYQKTLTINIPRPISVILLKSSECLTPEFKCYVVASFGTSI